MSAPNLGRIFDRRNRIPVKLMTWASLLMSKEGQEAWARLIVLGGVALKREWEQDNGPSLDDLFPEDT